MKDFYRFFGFYVFIRQIRFRLLLLFGAALFTPYHSLAQSGENTSYLTPSPEASGLAKYAATPVNLYTGTPQIGIPLLELPGRNVTVPIVLSYNASGIKVQDVASWVGLGWSLQAGGMISRVVRGLPDEKTNGYCSAEKTGNKVQMMQECIEKSLKGEWDTEPDLFFFNFMGQTGKFVLNADKQAILMPQSNLKISTQWLNDWVITDEAGNRYFFGGSGGYEANSSKTEDNTEPFNFISGWYLSKIISANGEDTVRFYYQTDGVIKYPMYRSTSLEIIEAKGSQNNVCDGGNTSKNTGAKNVTVSIYPRYLSSIETAQGRIVFQRAKGRLDFEGDGSSLSAVTLYDARGNRIKSLRLHHSYFKSLCIVDANCARLRLDSISEVTDCLESPEKEKIQTLQRFSYHLPPAITLDITARYSTEYDHWGYHNGNKTKSRIPSYIHNGKVYPGADKSPDAEKMKVFTLYKIETAAGGYTEFTYEPHDYAENGVNKMAGGLRIQRMTVHDGENPGKDMVTEYGYRTEEQPNLSSGILYKMPQYHSFYRYYYFDPGINNYPVYIPPLFCDNLYLWRHSQSMNEELDLDGTHIGYGTVTVSVKGAGKTVKKFTDLKERPDVPSTQYAYDTKTKQFSPISSQEAPFTPASSRAWERELPKEEKVYNDEGKLLKRTAFEYDFNLPIVQQIYGLKALLREEIYKNDYIFNVPYTDVKKVYHAGMYTVASKAVLLRKQTEEVYDRRYPGDPSRMLTNVTEYEYDQTYLLPKKITIYNPKDNIQRSVRYKYPFDYQGATGDKQVQMLERLRQRNALSVPVEQYKSIRYPNETEKVLSGALSLFDDYGMPGKVLSASEWTFSSPDGIPIAQFQVSASQLINNTWKFSYDAHYQKAGTFERYDAYGNPLAVRSKDGTLKLFRMTANHSAVGATIEGAETDENIVFADFDNPQLPEKVFGTASFGNGYAALFQGKKMSLSVKKTPGNMRFRLEFEAKKYASGTAKLLIKVGENVWKEIDVKASSKSNPYEFFELSTDLSQIAQDPIIMTFAAQTEGDNYIKLDNLRLYPEGLRVSHRQNRYGRTVAAVNADHKAAFYEYDEYGRLSKARDKDYNILQIHNTNFKKAVLCSPTNVQVPNLQSCEIAKIFCGVMCDYQSQTEKQICINECMEAYDYCNIPTETHPECAAAYNTCTSACPECLQSPNSPECFACREECRDWYEKCKIPKLKAEFTVSPSPAQLAQQVTFNAGGNNNPAGTLYSWDFGDGAKLQGLSAQVVHAYAQEGNYLIQLKAEKEDYTTAQGSKNLSVALLPLVVKIQGLSYVQAGKQVFYTTQVAGGKVPYQYQWQLQYEGSNTWNNYGNASSVQVQPSKSFWLKCTVTDQQGKKAEDTMYVEVENINCGNCPK